MKSHITERFTSLFSRLPPDAQQQARAAYRLFLQNPRHPSPHFKRVSAAHPEYHPARVGAHYRALGILDDDTVTEEEALARRKPLGFSPMRIGAPGLSQKSGVFASDGYAMV